MLQQQFGIPVEFLNPQDVPRVFPVPGLRLDDVLAATYCGRDGVSDPAGVTEGYRKNAARLGVDICTSQEVTGLEVTGGKVTAVRTAQDTISTNIVVNAAGVFAASIGNMAGVRIPVVPMRRFIWITRPFAAAPSRWTLVVDFKTGFYFHRESSGVLFGMGNREEGPSFDLSVDWDFFERVMETAIDRFPPLADAAIKTGWAGSYEVTPDAHPIVGRVPEVDGFILANGFSGHGFQHAPAIGQLVAEEIIDGRAHSIDISPLSINRFAHGATAVERNVI
jgi:sarcosine oxidase subunit beta